MKTLILSILLFLPGFIAETHAYGRDRQEETRKAAERLNEIVERRRTEEKAFQEKMERQSEIDTSERAQYERLKLKFG